jgi:hypothetical protein
VALAVYGLIQYVWKAAQWLIVTPLILGLLLVMGLIRLLAFFPPLRSSVIAGLSAVLNMIMLHWIAEAQVYTQDYTRSAGIRERFEREIVEFLRDDRCDRIVVIAHSMGTVIAYEGLTTVLTNPEFRDSQKAVTFVCLAAALRRVWLMTPNDPHRMRVVLPERVRWMHFWARYDPVAAGPLDLHSLPRLEIWPDALSPDPQATLRDRLKRCKNVDVVNTDSALTDHMTYWQNLDQVVGPIALELVAGHPALEQTVRAHLATRDEILLRRWRVAWRSTVALAAGFGLGLAVLLWDGSQRWMRVGHTLSTSVLKLVGDLVGTVATGVGTILVDVQQITTGIIGGSGPSVSVDVSFLPADIIWSVVAALVVTALGILLIGRATALRSPLVFNRGIPSDNSYAWRIAALATVFLGLPFFSRAFFDVVPGASALVTVEVVAVIGLVSDFFGLAAFILAVTSSWRRRKGGWVASIVLLTAPFALLVATFILVINGIIPAGVGGAEAAAQAYRAYFISLYGPAFAGAVVGIAGCLFFLITSVRHRRLGDVTLALILALILTWSAVAYLFNVSLSSFGVGLSALGESAAVFVHIGDQIAFIGIFMPVLVYALASEAAKPGAARLMQAGDTGIVNLSVTAYALLNALILLLALVPAQALWQVISLVGLGIVGLIGLMAFGWAVSEAVRLRQWGWLVAMAVITIAVALVTIMIPPSARPYIDTPEQVAVLVAAGPSAAALIYGLWGGRTLQAGTTQFSPASV